MKDADQVRSRSALIDVLSRIEMRGWLGCAWGWDVDGIDGGWLIRATFVRPDRDTGKSGVGAGRWLQVDFDSTARAVIGTAFTAIKLVVDHESLEDFHVDGCRPFDPHGPVFR